MSVLVRGESNSGFQDVLDGSEWDPGFLERGSGVCGEGGFDVEGGDGVDANAGPSWKEDVSYIYEEE